MLIYQTVFWLSLLLAIYIYFLYPVLLSFLALFHRKALVADVQDTSLPSVSIIIAAYNEEAWIEKKIQNCLALDYPEEKLEIIIGSDGSHDKTNELVEKYVNECLLFFPHSVRRGKMSVINDGVRQARGDICVFTDVSEMFDADAVKKLVRNFSDSTVGAVTGNHIYHSSKTELGRGTLLYWRYQRWLQSAESRMATILSCDGTIYACRRSLYIPPPAETINDDKAVPMAIVRQGFRVIFEPEAVVRGEVLPKAKAFFRQKVRGQAGMYQLFWLFRDMFRPKNLQVWFIFLSHSVGPVFAPWCLLMLLLTNLVLLDIYVYHVAFLLQMGFYFSALIGAVAQFFQFHTVLFHIPYFLIVSNIASIVGCWAFFFKIQKVTWEKVE